MPHKIEEIDGIGKLYAEELKAVGIITAEQLLEQGASRCERTRIAEEIGIECEVVLKWVIYAARVRPAQRKRQRKASTRRGGSLHQSPVSSPFQDSVDGDQSPLHDP